MPSSTPAHSACCRPPLTHAAAIVLLTASGGSAAAAPGFSLGLAHKAPSGALVKGKLEHSGLLALLYEQKVEGLGRLALTAATDASAVTSTTPKVGLTLYYA